MKLTIVDNFLKEHKDTHKDDCFYDGDLAFWEDSKGRKLYLMAGGVLDLEVDVKKATEDKVNIDWLYDYKDDESGYLVIEDSETAIAVFENGDSDIKKLEDGEEYLIRNSSNFSGMYFVNSLGVKIYINPFEDPDVIISIEEFINMKPEKIISWIEWFENDSSEGVFYKENNNFNTNEK